MTHTAPAGSPRDGASRWAGAGLAAGEFCLALLLAGGCGRAPSAPDGSAGRAVAEEAAVAEPGAYGRKEAPEPTVAARVKLPDVPLLTQRGETVRFHRDLVRGKVAAINFIFTTCQGVCPPLGTNFAALSRRMRDRLGKDVVLISVSVDPVNDTPERLAAWSRQFEADPGWTLVTGEKRDVDHLLKALGVYTAEKTQHSPFILIGDETTGRWSRLHGLTPPDTISETLDDLLGARSKEGPSGPATSESPGDESAAHRYFTDVELVDQDGRTRRLYTDLIRGRVVVVQFFFCSCRAACPALVTNFTKIRDEFRDRMGKDLFLLSVSVDPAGDTPAKLKEYAEGVEAGPGWYFLTGPKENVDFALLKFGQKVESKDNHSNLFIIGNETTGLWKKAVGLAKPDELTAIVASVLDDPGPEQEADGDGHPR